VRGTAPPILTVSGADAALALLVANGSTTITKASEINTDNDFAVFMASSYVCCY
jgi:hypothetical protein